MRDTLGVDINRTDLHSLEVADSFETDDSFVVELKNHGEGTHVHLHLDDSLSAVARLDAGNHYVNANDTRTVGVGVEDPSAWSEEVIRGRLKVVTGHGRETRYVNVTLDGTQTEPVEVDPELSKPQPKDEESPLAPTLRAIPVAVLGGVAVLLAVGALFAADGIDFVLGAIAVVAGVACAISAYYLLG